ncbi:hypothetical protein VTK56DRAFT_3122 [Thermocarpiscus australiensis]
MLSFRHRGCTTFGIAQTAMPNSHAEVQGWQFVLADPNHVPLFKSGIWPWRAARNARASSSRSQASSACSAPRDGTGSEGHGAHDAWHRVASTQHSEGCRVVGLAQRMRVPAQHSRLLRIIACRRGQCAGITRNRALSWHQSRLSECLGIGQPSQAAQNSIGAQRYPTILSSPKPHSGSPDGGFV